MQVIKEGYVIPLSSIPDNNILKNNASSRNNVSFVQEAIDKLMFSGVISEVFESPDVINPLTVAERNGKKRLCLDLRYINKFVKKRKVVFESVDLVLNFASHGAEKPGLYIAGASRLSPLGSALSPPGLMGRAYGSAHPSLHYILQVCQESTAGQTPRGKAHLRSR